MERRLMTIENRLDKVEFIGNTNPSVAQMTAWFCQEAGFGRNGEVPPHYGWFRITGEFSPLQAPAIKRLSQFRCISRFQKPALIGGLPKGPIVCIELVCYYDASTTDVTIAQLEQAIQAII
jgi:hypothetical protein